MTRKLILSTTTAIALMAAPVFAQTVDSASDVEGNSPRVTEGGFDNDVASQAPAQQNPTARYGIGVSEFDDNNVALSREAFTALSNTRGANFETESGEKLGEVTAVDFNARGFPELIIDLEPQNPLNAETLVITVQPGNVTLRDGKIFLAMTVDEMIAKAQSDGVRDDANAEITIF